MRHTNRVLAAMAVYVALSAAVAIGCGGETGGGGTPPPVSGRPDITGIIKTITYSHYNGEGATLLVVGDPDVTNSVDRAQVTITPKTVVWAPAGEGKRWLRPADLKAGQRVAIHFTGAVAESYPVQATAADVEVLSP